MIGPPAGVGRSEPAQRVATKLPASHHRRIGVVEQVAVGRVTVRRNRVAEGAAGTADYRGTVADQIIVASYGASGTR